MSDLTKVVQKLTETNKRLETLERQNTESGTPVELLKAALPEILSERAEGRKQRTQDKELFAESDKAEADRDKVAGSQFDKAQSPRLETPEKLGDNITEIMLQSELLEEQHQNEIKLGRLQTELLMALGDGDEDRAADIRLDIEAQQKQHEETLEAIKDSAPIPINKAVIEETKNDESKRRKEELASAFSPLKDGLNSIGQFFGGLKDKAKGGALTFLKAFGLAAGLGALIAFLESDFLKNLLSEENLKKISDGIKNMGNFFDGVLGYFTGDGALLTPTLLDAVAIGAAIIGIGAGIKLLKGFLFPTSDELKKATKGAKLGGLLKFTLVATAIGALASGISEGFKRYKETGELDKAIIAGFAGTLNFLTFGIFGQERIEKGLQTAYDKFIEDIFTPLQKFFREVGIKFGLTGEDADSKDAMIRLRRARANQVKANEDLLKQQQRIAALEAKREALLIKAEEGTISSGEENILRLFQTGQLDPAIQKLENIQKRVTTATELVTKLDTPELKASEEKRLENVKKENEEFKNLQSNIATRNAFVYGDAGGTAETLRSAPGNMSNMPEGMIGSNINVTNVSKGGDTTVNKTISDIPMRNQGIPDAILLSVY